MTEVQKCLLVLLKEIDAICRKYDIEYYLGGGSLIGAVRHGGFLPWDDDADVHMSRENAYKFLRAVEIEKPNNRMVHVAETRRNMNPHWRYKATDNTVLLRGNVGSDAVEGQFVDIFINYPLPLDPEKKERCLEDYKLYSDLKAENGIVDSHRTMSFLRRFYKAKRWEKLIGRDRVLRYLEKKVFHYPEDEAKEWFIAVFYAPRNTPQHVFLKEWWGKPRYVKFEDTELMVAEHAEKILSYAYGPTWFEVPQRGERGEHVFVVDMEIPYWVYQNDAHRRLDLNRFYLDEVRKKTFWFKTLWDRNYVMPKIRQLQGLSTCLEIEERVKKYNIDLNELVERGEVKRLRELFAPYFAQVSSPSIKYYGVYVDMPDEYLYAALCFMCLDEGYSVARKILRQRRECVDRELAPDLKRLCDLCDATDAMLMALYGDLDLGAARVLVDEWLACEPKGLYFLRADIYLRLNGYGEEPTDTLMRRCSDYLAVYSDDGELLKYQGDLLMRIGDVPKAEKCYRKALCTLKNGFCIKSINEYFQAKHMEALE